MLGKHYKRTASHQQSLPRLKGVSSKRGDQQQQVFQLNTRFRIALWQALCQVLDVESGNYRDLDLRQSKEWINVSKSNSPVKQKGVFKKLRTRQEHRHSRKASERRCLCQAGQLTVKPTHNYFSSQAQQHRPVIPELRRLRQEDFEFKVNLFALVNLKPNQST